MATVMTKGQITIPKKVREALGLRPGSVVVFEIRAGEVIMRKQVAPQTVDRWRGFLKCGRGTRTDELITALRGE